MTDRCISEVISDIGRIHPSSSTSVHLSTGGKREKGRQIKHESWSPQSEPLTSVRIWSEYSTWKNEVQYNISVIKVRNYAYKKYALHFTECDLQGDFIQPSAS